MHNANYVDQAVCYLKYSPNIFIKWVIEDHAVDLAEELMSSCAIDEDDKEHCIFHQTRDFNFDENRGFIARLVTKIRDRVPKFADAMEATCSVGFLAATCNLQRLAPNEPKPTLAIPSANNSVRHKTGASSELRNLAMKWHALRRGTRLCRCRACCALGFSTR